MLFARLKGLFRSLRMRLLAWNTLVILLMVLAILLVVREGVRRALVGELEGLLEEDVLETRLFFEHLYPDSKEQLFQVLNRKAQGHKQHGWFVQIFSGDGKLAWESMDAPALQTPVQRSRRARFVEEDGYRFIQEKIAAADVPSMYVRVGCSTEAVDQDMSLLTRTMVLASVLVLVLAPLGGYYLAGRATRPLAQIISTTARLHPRNLDERLPLRQTGDELDQLSGTINSMLDRIASYIERSHDFLANAAHELRSPLAAIRSSVEVSLNRPRSQEEYQGLLTDVMEECARLGNLVNRLLLLAESDVSGLEAGDAVVQLDLLVRDCLDMFQAVAEAQNVNLQGAELCPLRVRGEADRLRQVVCNLLDNALKFTPSGGKVSVEIHEDSQQQCAVLTVSDSGIGIPPADLPRVFERFFRGDKSRHHDAQRPGYGLGLSICEAIVASLGGTLEVDSVVDRGSTFTVKLPLCRRSVDLGAALAPRR